MPETDEGEAPAAMELDNKIEEGMKKELEESEGLDEDLFGSSDDDDEKEEEKGEKEGEGKDNASLEEGKLDVKSTPMAEDTAKGDEMADEDLFGSDSDADDDSDQKLKEETQEEKDEVVANKREPQRMELIEDPLDIFDVKEEVLHGNYNNFIRIEHEEFDPSTYDPGMQDQKGQFVVRWKKASDKGGEGSQVESNARLVKWSDGSMTLKVGDEHLDISTHDVSSDNLFIYARHSGFLKGVQACPKRIAFRPLSTKSKAHAMLSKGVDKRNVKAQKSKKITVVENPEMVQRRREKEEEAKLKEIEQLQKKQEKEMAKYGLSSYGDGGYGDRDLSVRYLEEDDEGEGGEWDDDATRRAREALAGVRTRTMGDGLGEKRILSAQQGEEEQTAKRQMFSRGLDESDEDGEEEKKVSVRGKAILMSDDEEEGD